MNPLNWRREHQVALLLGCAIEIAIGLLIGYMYVGLWTMYVATATAGRAPGPPRTIMEWLDSESGFRWGAFGALIGGAAVYTRQLLHV